MDKVRSEDDTAIAFDRVGEGPPIILVLGAFNDRATGAPLAAALQDRFSVVTYDRRGRGDSGDTPPYAVEREVEDLQAIIEEVGGSASVFGYSSGAVLSLMAAARGLAITRLALYDLPLSARGARIDRPEDLAARLAGLVEADRRGDAVALFQTEGVGDGSLPVELASSLAVPTLAIAGGESFPFMRETPSALAAVMPDVRARVLEGQSHDIVPHALAPALEEFFSEAR
jgi:pimeloyl-ACP methyl ester carboxylesterase